MYKADLIGLDGSNLLAYLAALGTLRALALADPSAEVRMGWAERETWIPTLYHSKAHSADDILDFLTSRVCGAETADRAWSIGDSLTLTCAEFGKAMRESIEGEDQGPRSTPDFLAAFGSDVYGAGPKKMAMSDTAFRTMSGAGHQHFLAFMRELAANTEREHLRRALFAVWDYADERPSLRWDPADYRPHALRASDPSTDPIRTMRGANRLAIEALPLFPTAPVGRRIRTTGFRGGDSGAEVVWPIWTDGLDVGSVRSVLASRVEEGRPGIAQVFRAVRFTEGKYRNFSPSKALF